MAESPGNRIASTIARLSPKQRQLLILGLGGSVFAVLIFGGVALWDQPTTLPEGTPPVRPQPLPISAPGAQADPRDIWMSKSSEQMRQMEEMIQGLRQQVDLIERKPPFRIRFCRHCRRSRFPRRHHR
jgi:conjugal transfer pilus assembly protein TraB